MADGPEAGSLQHRAGHAVLGPLSAAQNEHTRTDSGGAARSTVEALTFRAVTRTLFLDQTWRLRIMAMLLLSSEASAKAR